MASPFDIFDVIESTGLKLVAALILPSGLVTGAASTITGGTVTGTAAVPAGAAAVYLGLSETPNTYYGASSSIAGTALPNTADRPYMVEVRTVAGGTDMTSYAAIAAAFVASTTKAYTRDVPTTIINGMLSSGAWGAQPVAGGLTSQDVRDAMKLAPTAGAPAAGSIDDELDDIASGGGSLTAEQAEQLAETHEIVQGKYVPA